MSMSMVHVHGPNLGMSILFMDNGDGSFYVQGPLIRRRRRRFRLLRTFENRLYAHSRQGLVMVDLLDNFLNPLKLFFGRNERFPEIAMTEICRGSGDNDERRIGYR